MKDLKQFKSKVPSFYNLYDYELKEDRPEYIGIEIDSDFLTKRGQLLRMVDQLRIDKIHYDRLKSQKKFLKNVIKHREELIKELKKED